MEQETFLVIERSAYTDYVNAFVFQGTYEDVYKLEHQLCHLSIFLIQPDPTEQSGPRGQPLMRVENIRANNPWFELLIRAGYHLRQLPEALRKKEVASAILRLQLESNCLTQKDYSNSADVKKFLEERGVTPLTPEEMERLRR